MDLRPSSKYQRENPFINYQDDSMRG